METARETAMRLLNESGCSLDCYRGDYDNAIKDINYIITEDGRHFDATAEEIARALVEIGNELPAKKITHKPYVMIFETYDCCDGIECDSFEVAKCEAEDTYFLWASEEMREWNFDENGMPHPTEEQIENWDYMIFNCYCRIAKWNEEKQEYDYDNEYYLTGEELKSIGWCEWSELVNEI